jgi:hypothetical protein
VSGQNLAVRVNIPFENQVYKSTFSEPTEEWFELTARIAQGDSKAYEAIVNRKLTLSAQSINLDPFVPKERRTTFTHTIDPEPKSHMSCSIWAISALVLLGIYLYWPAWRYNRKTSEWLKDHQVLKSSQPFVLLERLPELLEDPPRWASVRTEAFASAIRELKQVIQGELGALTRKGPSNHAQDQEYLAQAHELLARLGLITRLDLERVLGVRWDTSRQQQRLFQFEANLISSLGADRIIERRVLLKLAQDHYDRYPQLPRNPALGELLYQTDELEAGIMLNELEAWRVKTPLNQTELDDFVGLATTYNENYGSFNPAKFDSIKHYIYDTYHQAAAAPLLRAYNLFKVEISEAAYQELTRVAIDYEEKGTGLPMDSGIRILAVQELLDRLKHDNLVHLNLRVGRHTELMIGEPKGILGSSCRPRQDFPLFHHGKVCIKIGDEEHKLPFKEILRNRHKIRGLIREIKWPPL